MNPIIIGSSSRLPPIHTLDKRDLDSISAKVVLKTGNDLLSECGRLLKAIPRSYKHKAHNEGYFEHWNHEQTALKIRELFGTREAPAKRIRSLTSKLPGIERAYIHDRVDKSCLLISLLMRSRNGDCPPTTLFLVPAQWNKRMENWLLGYVYPAYIDVLSLEHHFRARPHEAA
ncbi:MAG TPA: hypothetical protein DIC36_07400 [Gammaproteobacteria bacterium]|nr:hypothetical protein [Gammaproteobacteria bacterium]